MKVLWFVPIPFPAVQKRLKIQHDEGGWWVTSLFDEIKYSTNIQMGIAWSSTNINKSFDFYEDGITYYCISEGNNESNGVLRKVNRLFDLFKPSDRNIPEYISIINRFNPEIIHVHGSEKSFGLVGEFTAKPLVLSIQGITSEYQKVFWGKLRAFNKVSLPTVFYSYLRMKNKASIEKRIFKSNQNFIGRTDWDKSFTFSENPKGRYFTVGEILRQDFYFNEWDINKMIKHSIFTTSSALPYKGTDLLLESIKVLKKTVPDITLRITGNFPNSGYGKYLRNLVNKLGINQNVTFLGWKNAPEIVRELQRAHIFVLPSFIENSPNSLAEAQLVGTPVIASRVGGIPSMVIHQETGLLFSPGQNDELVRLVLKLFDNQELAKFLSTNERRSAEKRHSKKDILNSLLTTYSRILITNKHGNK